MYSSYTAAVFTRKHELAAKYGVNLEGALTWAFEFEGQPYFAGFRSLASNGLDKPVLNVFRMFSRMHGQRLPVESDHTVPLQEILAAGVRAAPDVGGLASGEGHKLWVLLWPYHGDDVPGPDAAVDLTIEGLPIFHGQAALSHYRIDENHSNAFAAWKRFGSPQVPSPAQYAELEKAGQLVAIDAPKAVSE